MDDKDHLIVRQTCIKAACELYAEKNPMNIELILKTALVFEEWIWRGMEEEEKKEAQNSSFVPPPVLCSNNHEMKLIPAGFSKKTHKPYNAFYSCYQCRKTRKVEDEGLPTF